MNTHSEICALIRTDHHWRDTLEKKHIDVKSDGCYAVFNYGKDADFTDPIVREARGIIIDMETLDVVCWPFRKFCNWEESAADPIDWSNARVQDKIDGSIIKLWYDNRAGKWQFSTNSTIYVDEACLQNFPGMSFLDLIHKTDEYPLLLRRMSDDSLNRDVTYIFELTAPENKIVIRYPKAKLWHTGARNNKTGVEMRTSDSLPGFDAPAEYPFSDLDECISAAKALNKDFETNGVKKEGFVVVDGSWNRIKVKSPEYVLLHRTYDNGHFSMKRMISGVREGLFTFDDMADAFPEARHIIYYYQWQMAELIFRVQEVCRIADQYAAEFSNDKKAIAMAIRELPFSWAAFRHLKTGAGADEILDGLDLHQYLKNIKKYE